MSTYLMHHGIKGQKWGIRRYQNEDGTLTPLGRQRVMKAYERAEAKEEGARKENWQKIKDLTAISRKDRRVVDAEKKYRRVVNNPFSSRRSRANAYKTFNDVMTFVDNEYGVGKLYQEANAITQRVYSHLVKDLGIENTKEGRMYVFDHFLDGLYDD